MPKQRYRREFNLNVVRAVETAEVRQAQACRTYRDQIRLRHCARMQHLCFVARNEIAACRCAELSGQHVRYLHSIYIPGESRCMCVFEADDGETVTAVNQAAPLVYTRILEVHLLVPQRFEC